MHGRINIPDVDAAFANALMEFRPKLVLFARSLCKELERSEDLASETVMRGWRYRNRFEPGTSLSAWLSTILRNLFMTEQRRKKWDGGFIEDREAMQIPALGSQEDHVHLNDLSAALDMLPTEQKEALLAVALEGDYEAAAIALDVNIGTIKSRVHRGRQALRDLFS